MASASGGEAEENYWPGYVDALTAMTKVLTFIMMILGIVIFAMSQNVSRALIESVAAAAKVEVPASGSLDELRGKLVEAITASRLAGEAAPSSAAPAGPAAPARPLGGPGEPVSPPGEETRIESASAPAAKAPVAGPAVGRSGAVITVSFRRHGIELDGPATEALGEALRAAGPAGGTGRVDVTAFAMVDGIAVSQARRLAFYRAMLVRNQLVKDGIAAGRISVRVEDGRGGEADLVRVVVR